MALLFQYEVLETTQRDCLVPARDVEGSSSAKDKRAPLSPSTKSLADAEALRRIKAVLEQVELGELRRYGRLFPNARTYSFCPDTIVPFLIKELGG